ncbi:unnamed protein product [Didymodactylos carnosus]|uniref:Uncharacterized protein n=1 Tax=Didymodactylos carnosus TaxID=1234261 RepID=A0A813U701_9BILA|nr:unnamed protein product [Didymodactylos carnosus]CAF3605670.1 unnamed protein product [Didymodactylos carnosus]
MTHYVLMYNTALRLVRVAFRKASTWLVSEHGKPNKTLSRIVATVHDSNKHLYQSKEYQKTMTNLYQWGIVYDPKTNHRGKCILPTCFRKPSPNINFQQVSCGTNFTVVLDTLNQVYIIGDEPKNGRLGQNDDTTIVSALTLLKSIPLVTYISCGTASTLLMTVDKELWGFGKGIGQQPRKILDNNELQGSITHCTCSQNSIVIVIDFSRVHEICFNQSGFTTTFKEVFRLIDSDTIQTIDVGSSLGAFVTQNGQIYLWGSVPVRGSSNEKYADVPITAPVIRNLDENSADKPVHVSCSRGQFHPHALLLTANGLVYSIGSNYKGKLGITPDTATFCSSWTFVTVSQTIPFKQICAGGIHSSALSMMNEVYTWGCGSDGRLGHPESEGHRYLYKEGIPRKIDTLSNVQYISSSYYHMAAIA